MAKKKFICKGEVFDMKAFFKVFVRIGCVLDVIACTIGGMRMGVETHSLGLIFLGLVLGFIAGIFNASIIFGALLTFISIDDNLADVNKKLTKIEGRLKYESSSNVKSESSSSSAVTYTEDNVWVCSKCGATNPSGTKICKSCGH